MANRNNKEWLAKIAANPDLVASDTGAGGMARALEEQHGHKLKTERLDLEHIDQVAVISWSRRPDILEVWPQLEFLHAIPNASMATPWHRKEKKAEGLVAGMPDLFLPCQRGAYGGLYIEMKVRPRMPRPNQQRAIRYLRSEGYFVDVCWGSEEAIDLLKQYMELSAGETLGHVYQLPA